MGGIRRRGNCRTQDFLAAAGLPAVVVRLDGRFAHVSPAAQRLLGRHGRLPRSWRDTILPLSEAGHLAGLVRRVGQGGLEQTHLMSLPMDGAPRRLQVRLHAAPQYGQVVALFDWVDADPSVSGQAMATEVLHRVRNALQVMSALIHLEEGEDGAIAARFELVRNRILAMAQAHDSLSVRTGIALVDLGACIRSVHALVFGVSAPLRLDLSGAAPLLPLDVAVPLTLIVHEVLLSAPKQAASIEVRLNRQDDGMVIDLPGISVQAEFLERRLVSALARQAGIHLAMLDGGGIGLRLSAA